MGDKTLEEPRENAPLRGAPPQPRRLTEEERLRLLSKFNAISRRASKRVVPTDSTALIREERDR